MSASTKTYAEQYYVFTGPDGWAWVEMFWDTNHVTAPSPCREVSEQIALLKSLHPDAMVDELLPGDIADALTFAL